MMSENEVDDQVSEVEMSEVEMSEVEETNHNMLFDADEFAKRGLSKKRQLTPKQEKFAQLFVHHDLTKKECALLSLIHI